MSEQLLSTTGTGLKTLRLQVCFCLHGYFDMRVPTGMRCGMGFFSATGHGSEMGMQYLSRKFLLNFCIHNYVFRLF